jgi:hypothetical protein
VHVGSCHAAVALPADESKEFRASRIPEDWKDKPAKLPQKDRDAAKRFVV